MPFLLALVTLALGLAPAAAQFAPPSVTSPPPMNYGVQPAEPTRGFNHPNDMGFGQYRNPTRLKGHRGQVYRERRFKGY